MRGSGKGQASVELLVVLSAIVVILVVMMLFVYRNYVRGDELKVQVHGSRVVNSIAENINEISIVGSGFSQYFTLPDFLYGERNYTVNFFQNESAVYIHGGSFIRGIELVWSAPISTVKVHCLRAECTAGCNRTPDDFCLKVNDTLSIRVVNDEGIVYLAYPYNLKQGNSAFYATPFRGNRTYDNTTCKRGSFAYLYKNRDDGSMNLVFQHNSSMDSSLKLNFSEFIGSLNATFSDDAGELNVSYASWNLTNNQCDGGVIRFDEGVHLCMKPTFQNSLNWTWLNGDGSYMLLNETKTVCLTYP